MAKQRVQKAKESAINGAKSGVNKVKDRNKKY